MDRLIKAGERTPYDDGTRLEPYVYVKPGIPASTDSYGRVDFDTDDGATMAIVYVERDDRGGFTLHIEADDVSVELNRRVIFAADNI